MSLMFLPCSVFYQPFSLWSPSPSCSLGHCSIFACFYFAFFFHFSSLSPPILILAAIFIAVPFSSLPSILSLFSQTAIITAFHRLDLSFVGLPFLLHHIHLAAKDTFIVTTGHCPIFCFFLLSWLSFLSSFSLHPTLQHCCLSP